MDIFHTFNSIPSDWFCVGILATITFSLWIAGVIYSCHIARKPLDADCLELLALLMDRKTLMNADSECSGSIRQSTFDERSEISSKKSISSDSSSASSENEEEEKREKKKEKPNRRTKSAIARAYERPPSTKAGRGTRNRKIATSGKVQKMKQALDEASGSNRVHPSDEVDTADDGYGASGSEMSTSQVNTEYFNKLREENKTPIAWEKVDHHEHGAATSGNLLILGSASVGFETSQSQLNDASVNYASSENCSVNIEVPNAVSAMERGSKENDQHAEKSMPGGSSGESKVFFDALQSKSPVDGNDSCEDMEGRDNDQSIRGKYQFKTELEDKL